MFANWQLVLVVYEKGPRNAWTWATAVWSLEDFSAFQRDLQILLYCALSYKNKLSLAEAGPNSLSIVPWYHVVTCLDGFIVAGVDSMHWNSWLHNRMVWYVRKHGVHLDVFCLLRSAQNRSFKKTHMSLFMEIHPLQVMKTHRKWGSTKKNHKSFQFQSWISSFVVLLGYALPQYSVTRQVW